MLSRESHTASGIGYAQRLTDFRTIVTVITTERAGRLILLRR